MRFAGKTRSAVLSRSSRAQENALPHAAYRCEESADSPRGISTASPQEQSATLPQGESLTAPQEENALSVASAARGTPIPLRDWPAREGDVTGSRLIYDNAAQQES
jgi:hypothetical protein